MDLACTNNQIDLQSPSTSSVRCVAHTHWNYLRIGTPVAELENTRPNYIAAQCVYPPSVVFPSSCLVPSTSSRLFSMPCSALPSLGTEWSWSDWKIISAKGVSEEMNIDWPAGCCWSVSLYYELAAALWTDESEHQQQTLTEGGRGCGWGWGRAKHYKWSMLKSMNIYNRGSSWPGHTAGCTEWEFR